MGLTSLYKLSIIINMVDNMSNPAKKIGDETEKATSKIDAFIQKSQGLAKSGTAMMLFGREITNAILSPVKATFETNRAIGELSSLGIENIEALKKSAEDFSDTWAGTTQADFITAAYDIKSGIASLSDEGVAKYTEMAGLTAKATKATTAEMTSLFATGYGIYKNFYKDLSDEQFGEIFSAGISESVRAFKTSGSGMAQAIQSMGASATTANVPLEEQLSILGMLQATMSGSEAGTKYRAFIKSAAKAGDELGLAFTDANNQLLSMPEIINALKGKFGETIDAAEKMELTKAFGTDEAVALIDLLYGKTGDLENNIISLNGAMGQGLGIANKMADTINSEPGDQYEVLTQQVDNLKQKLGTQLLPTVVEFMGKASETVTKISAWADEHKELVQIIMKLAFTLSMMFTIIGGFNMLIGGMGMLFGTTARNVMNFANGIFAIPGHLETISIYAMYTKDALIAGGKSALLFGKNLLTMAGNGIMACIQALPGLIASVWSFTAALLANPITWIVLAVVALGAALYMLWKHWDTVTGFISKTWNKFTNWIVSSFNRIRNRANQLPGGFYVLLAAVMPFIGIPILIMSHWRQILNFFQILWKKSKSIFKSGIDGIKNSIKNSYAWFRNSGRKIIDTFVSGIRSVISKPYEIVKSGLNRVRQLLPFSDAKEGPLSTLTLSGKRVFTTISEGMDKTKDLPGEKTTWAFKKVKDLSTVTANFSPGIKYEKKQSSASEDDKKRYQHKKDKGDKTVIIQKLLLNLPDVKELQEVLKLLSELRDYAEGEGVVTE